MYMGNLAAGAVKHVQWRQNAVVGKRSWRSKAAAIIVCDISSNIAIQCLRLYM